MNEISKALQKMAHRKQIHDLFSDFVEMSALTLSNQYDYRKAVEREERYLAIAKQYTGKELSEFCRCLALLAIQIRESADDVLGKVFHELELSNKYIGQFFTPQCICDLMAEMSVHDMAELMETKEFIRVMEPAVGSGAMILGVVKSLRKREIAVAERIHVVGVDIDSRAVWMSYVQLSLAGVPATVIHGNTLTLEEWNHWYTPEHILRGWGRKLRKPAGQSVEQGISVGTATGTRQLEFSFE